MGWFGQDTRGNGDNPAGARPKTANGNGGRLAGGAAGMPPKRAWLTFLVVLLANYLLVRYLFPGPDAPIVIPYTAFKEEVARGNVESIYTKGESIEGRLAKEVTWPPPGAELPPGRRGEPTSRSDQLNRASPRTATTFTTTLPAFVGPDSRPS